jgi:uncharacterized protein (DUF362 family)
MLQKTSNVALIKGYDRKENLTKSLNLIKNDIFDKIKSKKILIKPNFVSDHIQLASTEVEAIEAVIIFFKNLGCNDIIIAESSAGNTKKAYENFGYTKLKEVKLIDLDDEEYEYFDIGIKVPISKLFLNDYFIVSLAKAKTHDSVIATLSLKNILMGCITKIKGNEKDSLHNLGNKELGLRIAKLTEHIYPDLAIIDGFMGMEGNGPVDGTPVDSRFAIASIDALSADRVCLECMGIHSRLYCIFKLYCR